MAPAPRCDLDICGSLQRAGAAPEAPRGKAGGGGRDSFPGGGGGIVPLSGARWRGRGYKSQKVVACPAGASAREGRAGQLCGRKWPAQGLRGALGAGRGDGGVRRGGGPGGPRRKVQGASRCGGSRPGGSFVERSRSRGGRRRPSRPRSACGRRARPRGGRCPPWAECPRGPAREGGREDRRRQGVATLRVPGPGGPGRLALTLSHQQPPFFQTKGVRPPGDEAWSCGTELSSAGRRLGPGWYVTGPAAEPRSG